MNVSLWMAIEKSSKCAFDKKNILMIVDNFQQIDTS